MKSQFKLPIQWLFGHGRIWVSSHNDVDFTPSRLRWFNHGGIYSLSNEKLVEKNPTEPNSEQSSLEKMPALEEPVMSPCVMICCLGNDDICLGCYRSAQEITYWMRFDNKERKDVLKRCDERARAAGAFL